MTIETDEAYWFLRNNGVCAKTTLKMLAIIQENDKNDADKVI